MELKTRITRSVLECASPLALSQRAKRLEMRGYDRKQALPSTSGRRLPHSKTSRTNGGCLAAGTRNSFRIIAALLMLFAFLALTAQAQLPQLLHYQGRAIVSNTNFEGTGQFKFALVNGTGNLTYWSNDGSSTTGNQPGAGVSLPVTKGLYALLLGDTALSNMTAVLPSAFANSDVRLRVWFNDGAHGYQQVAPDQRIAAVGYAMVAGSIANGTISGGSLRVEGLGNEAAYLGGDGIGGDVEVGSFNPAIADVVLYNSANGKPMNLLADGVIVDASNQNTGGLTTAALRFSPGSGEGISSKRDGGGNQYGLDFFTGFLPRLSIALDGKIGIGTQAPTALLDVAGLAKVDGLRLGTSASEGAVMIADTSGNGHWGQTLRVLPNWSGFPIGTLNSANILAGAPNNSVGSGIVGATISGGGFKDSFNGLLDAPNVVGGDYATVPGGYGNQALGNYSFAAGVGAQASHIGAFVWHDAQGGAFPSTTDNQFNVMARGGVRFETGGAGMTLDGQPLLTSSQLPSNVARLDASPVFTSLISASSGLRMNDASIMLHNDSAHGLGYRSLFAGVTMDGPALYGYANGVLGTTDGGEKAALAWNRDGNVGIGTSSPTERLQVNGSLKIVVGTTTVTVAQDGSVTISAGNADINIAGGNINLNASQNIKLTSGGRIDLN